MAGGAGGTDSTQFSGAPWPPPPAGSPPRRTSRRWPWIALGLFALAGMVVSVAAVILRGDDERLLDEPRRTVAPASTDSVATTSTAEPADAPPRTEPQSGPLDIRARIGDPADYAPHHIRSADDDPDASPVASSQLFVAPGASWEAGPWLLVVLDTGDDAVFDLFPFLDEPQYISVNHRRDSWTGSGALGAQQTLMNHPSNSVAIIAQGLPDGTTLQVATFTELTDGAIHLGDRAIPDELRPFAANAYDAWVASWSTAPSSAVMYLSGRDLLVLESRPVEGWRPTMSSAPFFLRDELPIAVRGVDAWAGRFDYSSQFSAEMIVWTEGDVELRISSAALSAPELLAAAQSVVLPGDDEWSEAAWQRLVDAAEG